MTKVKGNESSRTKVKIHKSCVKPNDKDLRVLEVNWMKKEVKGVKYRQSRITHQFPIEKLCIRFSVPVWDPFLTWKTIKLEDGIWIKVVSFWVSFPTQFESAQSDTFGESYNQNIQSYLETNLCAHASKFSRARTGISFTCRA